MALVQDSHFIKNCHTSLHIMNHITSLAPTRYTQELARIFAPHANSERAPAMAAYMRNHFAFFGIMSGPRTALTKEFIRQHGHPGPDILPKVVQTLWQYPEREFQYAACELLIAASKTGSPDLLPLVEHCITHKSWWDTVDTLAPRVAGAIYAKHPKEVQAVVDAWIHSPNFWLNRSAIILQLSYKQHTDLALLERAIVPHLSSKEFFIQKAIGWALRQYSYVNAPWVVEFVHTHPLAPLSTREALKALRRQAERAHRTC
jgi:3-methyladenine DNA glycosylase AlkD